MERLSADVVALAQPRAAARNTGGAALAAATGANGGGGGGTGVLFGDVTGPETNTLVVGIEGVPLSGAPAGGDDHRFLRFDSGLSQFVYSGAVMTAPDADTRNRVQPTGDFIPLSVEQAAVGQTHDLFVAYANDGTTKLTRLTSDGTISSPGAGAGSEHFGFQSGAPGIGSTALGRGSFTVGLFSSAVGTNASTQGDYASAIGGGAAANAALSTAIGANSDAETASIVIGAGAFDTAAGQLIIGSGELFFGAGPPGCPITDAYLGSGVTFPNPVSVTVHGTGGRGTNIAGASLTFAGGQGTGSAVGGDLIFQSTLASGAGSSLNALHEIARLSQLGLFSLTQLTSMQDRTAFDLTPSWATSTDASRKGRAVFNIWDTAAREAIRIEASGSAPMISFLGAPAVVRPSNTTDLRQALINLGLYSTGGATPLDLNTGTLTAGIVTTGASFTVRSTGELDANGSAGVSGQFLKSQGAGASALWADLPADTDSLAALSDVSLSGVAQGDILYRGAATWNNLGHGVAGQVLTTNGVAANPSWTTLTPDLTNAVILAPGSDTRNRIQPSGDFIPLSVEQAAAGQTHDLFVAYANDGTTKLTRLTSDGTITSPSSGFSLSEHFGAGSSAAASAALAIGASALANFARSTALGEGAQASDTDAVAVGNVTTAALQAVAMGSLAVASNNAVSIGRSAQATAGGVAIGVAAVASVSSGVALGPNALSSDLSCTAVGDTARATFTGSTALGSTANAHGDGATALGSQTDAGFLASIALGVQAKTTGVNQWVVGGSLDTTHVIRSAYFGGGVTSPVPQSFTLNATGGSGANIGGASLSFAGGQGTGNAIGGDLIFQSSYAGGAGSSLNALHELARLSQLGVFSLTQLSSIQDRTTFDLTPSWATSTDASRKARAVFNIWDTAAREAMRIEASGSAPMIGFLGANASLRAAATSDLLQDIIGFGLKTGGGAVPLSLNAGQLANFVVPRRTVTSNAAVTSTDLVVNGDTSAGSFTLTLPTAVGADGRYYLLKNTGQAGNPLTVATTGGQKIDGGATAVLMDLTAITVVSDNANWWIN